MSTTLSPRKFEKIGYLSAVYEKSYFKPKVFKFKKNTRNNTFYSLICIYNLKYLTYV